jgi:hypothetical protein
MVGIALAAGGRIHIDPYHKTKVLDGQIFDLVKISLTMAAIDFTGGRC